MIIDEKNVIDSDSIIADDQIFIFRNIFVSKEAQIMNLQYLITCYIERKEELCYEYCDIDGKTINNCMDNFMGGIRNDMARTTRLLNIQQNKGAEYKKEICEKTKELEELRNPKFNTPNVSNTPDLKSTNNTFKSSQEYVKIESKPKFSKVIFEINLGG